jgi:serine/threonine-protein kinase
VRGQTLRVVLKYFKAKNKTVPCDIAARIAAGICEGLHYAHELKDDAGTALNIVHRDVAPDNIILSSSGVPKLLDFGVAKAMSQTQRTAAGTLKGKFAYMAPELVRGAPADRASDVYAMGVTLYELVTGKRPFSAENELALIEQISKGKMMPPHQANPNVPMTLSAIITMAIESSPNDRFQDARTMQRALDEWLVSSGARVSSPELAELVEAINKERPSVVYPPDKTLGTPVSSTGGRAPQLATNVDDVLPVVVGVLESDRPKRRVPRVLIAMMICALLATLGAIGVLVLKPEWLP